MKDEMILETSAGKLTMWLPRWLSLCIWGQNQIFIIDKMVEERGLFDSSRNKPLEAKSKIKV